MFIFILLIGFLSIIVYRQFNITNNVNRILCLHPYANCTTAKCITSSTKNTVLFISTWETKPDRLQPFLIKQNGESIDWKDYFSAERSILEFLDTWCAQREKTLMICGRSTEAASDEISFYQKYLHKCKWVYLPRGEIYATYHYIDSAEIVVLLDANCASSIKLRLKSSGPIVLGKSKAKKEFCSKRIIQAAKIKKCVIQGQVQRKSKNYRP